MGRVQFYFTTNVAKTAGGFCGISCQLENAQFTQQTYYSRKIFNFVEVNCSHMKRGRPFIKQFPFQCFFDFPCMVRTGCPFPLVDVVEQLVVVPDGLQWWGGGGGGQRTNRAAPSPDSRCRQQAASCHIPPNQPPFLCLSAERMMGESRIEPNKQE